MLALLNKLDKRQFHMLLGGGVLLLATAGFSAMVLPQLKTYRVAVATQAALPPAPPDGATLQTLLAARDSAIVERSRQLHGDMAELPSREIEAFVVDKLQQIAWRHNVVLQGVQPVAGETIESFREILFKLELRGQYADLFAWVSDLRTELGFIVIKEYQMQRLTNTSENPLLKVQVTIASYRRETT